MSQITKLALANSLVRLLQTTTLERITVRDITDDCGLNRQTFYYHFQDVYDLLHWIFAREIETTVEMMTGKRWQDALSAALKRMEEKQKFVRNVYRSIAREQLELALKEVVNRLLRTVFAQHMEGLNVPPSKYEFILNFYTDAFTMLCLDWVREGMAAAPDEIIADLSTLLEGDFQRALERFAQ